jgi:hypothetical protein
MIIEAILQDIQGEKQRKCYKINKMDTPGK